MSLTKTCNVCAKSKTLDQFPAHPLGLYGRQGYCRKCNADKCKAHYQKKKQALLDRVAFEAGFPGGNVVISQ